MITMETTNQQSVQNVKTRRDETIIDMVKHLQTIAPPHPQYLSSCRFRPRSTHPARSPRSAYSLRLARLRRPPSSAPSVISCSGRLSRDDLFWPPSQVTDTQLSDPATCILVNTAKMTLISCAADDGGTMYYFAVPPCRKGRARR
jgi:hypothetical protein